MQLILLTKYIIYMKAKLTLILLLTSVTLYVNAQSSSFNFGLRAAPQICWMKSDVDNWSGNGAKTGFSWGFIAAKNFSDNYSLSSGFNMLFNGGKLKFPLVVDGVSGTMNREYFLKYLEIPVSLKMRTNSINGIKYFGRIGLGSAFKVGSKAEDNFVSNTGTSTKTPKKNYDKINFARESLIIGMGGEYELSGGPTLGVELTFNNGFTNILTETGQKAKPNSLELAVSILF